MAEHGFNFGSRGGGGAGFLGLDQRYVAGIIIAVVLAVAILGAAFIMRPTPTPVTPGNPVNQYQAAEIACLEGGGSWNRLAQYCQH